MSTLQQNLRRPFYIRHLLERLRYGKSAIAMRTEAAELIEWLVSENVALGLKLDTARMEVDELQRAKVLADGMANMIRGFIFKTVERETLDEVAAKYRKWEEDYCHRGGA